MTAKKKLEYRPTMSYENAPSTEMLATHCAACGRPLRDAISVELGIGPICREKFGLLDAGLSEEARQAANKLVHWVAVKQNEQAFTEGAEQLRQLGFTRLADIIFRRSQEWKQAERRAALIANSHEIIEEGYGEYESPEAAIIIEEEGDFFLVRSPLVESSLEAWRNIPGRKWDWSRKVNRIPKTSKKWLWALFLQFFPGELGEGPQGSFIIPGTKAPF